MLKILLFLAISAINPHIKITGNRVLAHSIILNTVSEYLAESDSIIALKILNLYLERGFPFARVKITRSRDSIFISIKEGPLAKISGVRITPERYEKLRQILPDMRGKIFTPSLLKTVEERINSTEFLKFDYINFLKTEKGIWLLISVEETGPPAQLIAAASGNARNLSGFARIKFRSISGRPVDLRLFYLRGMDQRRSIEFSFLYPYFHGWGLSLYGSYRNEINGSDVHRAMGGGFVYQVKGILLRQGVQRQDSEVFAETGFQVKTEIFKGDLNLIYRTKRYRVTSSMELLVWKLNTGLLIFTQSDPVFQVEKLGGTDFLRGYRYGSIEATSGWCFKVELNLLKPFFVFYDYGLIRDTIYKSAGMGVRFTNGEIVYGLPPGERFSDGILTVALKIGF